MVTNENSVEINWDWYKSKFKSLQISLAVGTSAFLPYMFGVSTTEAICNSYVCKMCYFDCRLGGLQE